MSDKKGVLQECIIDGEYYPWAKEAIETIRAKAPELLADNVDAKNFRKWLKEKVKEKNEPEHKLRAVMGMKEGEGENTSNIWLVELWMLSMLYKKLYTEDVNSLTGVLVDTDFPEGSKHKNLRWKMLGDRRKTKLNSALTAIRALRNEVRSEDFIHIPKAHFFMGGDFWFCEGARSIIKKCCDKSKSKNYFDVGVDDFLDRLEEYIEVNAVVKKDRRDINNYLASDEKIE